MTSSKRDSSKALRRSRQIPADRRVWAGLHTPAEYLVAGLAGSPEVIAMTSGAWSMTKVLGLLLERVGQPGEVDVWTWTLSRKAIAQLGAWRSSGVAARAAVDASLWRRQPAYGRALEAALGDRLRAASLHAKAARVTGPAGSVFLAGSGNLNLCRRAELVFLSRDAALSSWLEGLTDRLFEALPAGAPRGSDEERADRLARAFPAPDVRPAWAAGVPVLGA
jgi:hypothetical protein